MYMLHGWLCEKSFSVQLRVLSIILLTQWVESSVVNNINILIAFTVFIGLRHTIIHISVYSVVSIWVHSICSCWSCWGLGRVLSIWLKLFIVLWLLNRRVTLVCLTQWNTSLSTTVRPIIQNANKFWIRTYSHFVQWLCLLPPQVHSYYHCDQYDSTQNSSNDNTSHPWYKGTASLTLCFSHNQCWPGHYTAWLHYCW